MATQNAILNQPEIDRRADLLNKECKVNKTLATKIAEHSIRRKTITPGWLADVGKVSREEAVATCNRMEGAGILKPKKNAKKFTSSEDSAKSKYDCLFTVDQVKKDALPFQVKLHCDPGKFNNAVKDHPWLITDNKRELGALDRWLGSTYCKGIEPVSDHERSYEIWGDEKALEDKSRTPRLKPLLTSLGFDLATLNVYCGSPGDFASYVLPAEGKVLMSENRDMHYALKKILRKNGPVDLLGERIIGTVFGSGNKARGDGFGEFLRDEEIAPSAMLYIGDIDPAGIAIQQDLEDKYGVRPFRALYCCMTERHTMRRQDGKLLDRYVEQQNDLRYNRERFIALLDETLHEEACRCLSKSVRIPQEIISGVDLREMIA